MSDEHLSEITLIDLSRAQRLALAERWPRILLDAGEFNLAGAFRTELSDASKAVWLNREAA